MPSADPHPAPRPEPDPAHWADHRVPVDQLRWRCDPATFAVAARAAGDDFGIEQERARRALKLALEIDAPGYHAFVIGLPGSGRSSHVRHLLEQLADRVQVVRDKAFVHHFGDPERPLLIELPAGRMGPFARRMAALADELLLRVAALPTLERELARAAFRPLLDAIVADFPFDAVRRQLAALEEWLLDPRTMLAEAATQRRLRHRLAVNVIVDAAARTEAPILFEPVPTIANLFGSIDLRPSRGGALVADHRGIRAGSLVRADGGYLVLKADEVLAEEGIWPLLKRALKRAEVEIAADAGAPISLRPQPVPIQVKVVLIGDASQEALLEQDPEFRKVFKVRAEFDGDMERTPENLARFAAFLRRLAEEEKLLAFTPAAIAAAAEEAVRRAGGGARLTTRFSVVADLARESNLVAQRDGARAIDAPHVALALSLAREREDLPEQKLRERIRDGTVLIATDGERIGQVNALTVVEAGEFAFGRVVRITATVAAGDRGLLNVEREVQLSGEIHDKGVFILTSLLRERFGQNHPVSLDASLCFEQSYGPVDGDSASASEFFALLSALSWTPLRQGIAVTGSINQKGDVQPVGAVNEKVEGFFDLCAQQGLTGRQGVVIPGRNRIDLMLAPRVVDAVAAGRFHVFAIDHVDAGLELLTGVEAGVLGADGSYPKESVNGRCADRLWYLAEVARDFKGANEGALDKKSETPPP